MSEADQENVPRYTPQHPLPEEIQKMERDETICRYCGISYLIHSEIKALEKKLKLVEKELEHYKGCQERENKLKEELQILQDQKGEFEMTITVKDAAIATLTNSLKSQESISESLRNQKSETEKQLLHAAQTNKALKDRNNELERHLPSMKMALHQQKIALEDIHSFMEKRDLQMKAELEILLQHVQATCENETKEKQTMETQMLELRARWDNTLQETEDLQSRLGKQEEQIRQLDKLFTENKNLKERCTALENANKGLQKQFDEAIEKCRSLQMETQQFKEQFKTKTSEVEELTTTQRRKEQALEMTMMKLKSDLKQRDNALDGAKREVKELQNKLEQQMQHEADISRQTAKSSTETKDLKESFFRAKEEIENLKEEREAMITSHQNRIEQLRASFKEKLLEADSWQEKLEAAIQKEKERHARELQELETRLKESFVMELEIEKGKYRELMKKYQTGSQETEEKLRAQLQSIESRYKAEINDLNELLAESRRKSKEVEEELRREIASLKAIIKDLEARLARLDVGNEDLVMKLKSQLRETHQELEMTREILDKEKKNSENFKEEVKHLQETVQKECEERFELTEALSVAKEELLQIKKPVGSQSNASCGTPSPCSPPSRNSLTRDSPGTGGYTSTMSRQLTNVSLPATDDVKPNMAPRRSISEPSPVIGNSPVTNKPHTYNGGVKKEYTLTNSNTMVFTGDNSYGQRQVGASTKRTGGTLAENRRRIAAILGRK